MLAKLFKSIFLLLFLAVGAAAALIYWGDKELNRALTLPESGWKIEVEPGESLYHVVADLESEQILQNGWLLRLWARFQEQTLVQRGEYQLAYGLTPLQLLEQLNSGEVVQYRITLVEGNSFETLLSEIQSNANLEIVTKELSRDELLVELNLQESGAEGWLYPDTYHFAKGTTDLELLRRAHQKMQAELNDAWNQRGPLNVIKSPYEALILASIVEKETGAVEERPTIAGVFIRRLQKGMRLQTDPTVIYGIPNYAGNITRRDLNTWTPYNTYMIDGLPPTPIAMPGRAAIDAVLHPEEGDALYFVARGDGRHYFSATLAEHNAAVRKYQIEQRSENYRSSPD